MAYHDNLPPGCTVNDLPGNSPQDEFSADYMDKYMDSAEKFVEWFQYQFQTNTQLSDKDCHALLEFEDIADMYNDYLHEESITAYERGDTL